MGYFIHVIIEFNNFSADFYVLKFLINISNPIDFCNIFFNIILVLVSLKGLCNKSANHQYHMQFVKAILTNLFR